MAFGKLLSKKKDKEKKHRNDSSMSDSIGSRDEIPTISDRSANRISSLNSLPVGSSISSSDQIVSGTGTPGSSHVKPTSYEALNGPRSFTDPSATTAAGSGNPATNSHNHSHNHLMHHFHKSTSDSSRSPRHNDAVPALEVGPAYQYDPVNPAHSTRSHHPPTFNATPQPQPAATPASATSAFSTRSPYGSNVSPQMLEHTQYYDTTSYRASYVSNSSYAGKNVSQPVLMQHASFSEPGGAPQTSVSRADPAWSAIRLTSPPLPRTYHSAAISQEGDVFLFGGLADGTVQGDVWYLDSSTMEIELVETDAQAANGPSPRAGHATDLLGNVFIVFGGVTVKERPTDDTDNELYFFNTTTHMWRIPHPIGRKPEGRFGHSLVSVADNGRPRIFLFGGRSDHTVFGDLVCFDLTRYQKPDSHWEWVSPAGGLAPQPRANHSMVVYRGDFYLFGGTDGARCFDDVWRYNLAGNFWEELQCSGTPPAPREEHTASVIGSKMYVFGGITAQKRKIGSLAVLDLDTLRWTVYDGLPGAPAARTGHSATVFDEDKLLIMGGDVADVGGAGTTDSAAVYILDTTRLPIAEAEAEAELRNSARLSQMPLDIDGESTRLGDGHHAEAELETEAEPETAAETETEAGAEQATEVAETIGTENRKVTVESSAAMAAISQAAAEIDEEETSPTVTSPQKSVLDPGLPTSSGGSTGLGIAGAAAGAAGAVSAVAVGSAAVGATIGHRKAPSGTRDSPILVQGRTEGPVRTVSPITRSTDDYNVLLASFQDMKHEMEVLKLDLRNQAEEASRKITAAEKERDEAQQRLKELEAAAAEAEVESGKKAATEAQPEESKDVEKDVEKVATPEVNEEKDALGAEIEELRQEMEELNLELKQKVPEDVKSETAEKELLVMEMKGKYLNERVGRLAAETSALLLGQQAAKSAAEVSRMAPLAQENMATLQQLREHLETAQAKAEATSKELVDLQEVYTQLKAEHEELLAEHSGLQEKYQRQQEALAGYETSEKSNNTAVLQGLNDLVLLWGGKPRKVKKTKKRVKSANGSGTGVSKAAEVNGETPEVIDLEREAQINGEEESGEKEGELEKGGLNKEEGDEEYEEEYEEEEEDDDEEEEEEEKPLESAKEGELNLTSIQAELDELKTLVGSHNTALAEAKAAGSKNSETLAAENEELKAQLAELQTAKETNENSQKTELEKLRADLDALQENYKETITSVNNSSKALMVTREELNRTKELNAKLESQIEKLKESSGHGEQSIEDSVILDEDFNSETGRLKIRLQNLQSQLIILEGENKELKSKLEASNA